MNNKKDATKISVYLAQLVYSLSTLDAFTISSVADFLRMAEEVGKTVFVMGNGGSGATASHMVCDLNKGVTNRKFKAICLNDNVPSILAYSNDESYDLIFRQQLKNLMGDGDIVIGISASGSSRNIIEAFEYAKENNAYVIAFTGKKDSIVEKMANLTVCVNTLDVQQAEDAHLAIVHILMRILLGEE